MLPAASFEVLFHNAHLKTCERSALRQRCDGVPWQNTMLSLESIDIALSFQDSTRLTAVLPSMHRRKLLQR